MSKSFLDEPAYNGADLIFSVGLITLLYKTCITLLSNVFRVITQVLTTINGRFV